ncbi:MAG: diguanylate cyclase [Armatimonadetes bacterium]|nr:diguanylate cyclase [Armatimonadota bacterium]
MSDEPNMQNKDTQDTFGGRFPKDVDTQREQERLLSVSEGRADIYQETARAARELQDDFTEYDATQRGMGSSVDALTARGVPKQFVLDLTLLVSGGATTADLRQAVLDRAMELFGAEKGTILEPDETGTCLRMAAARAHGHSVRQSFVLGVDEGVAGRVYATGQQQIVPDTSSCEFFTPNPESDARGRLLVAVPLSSDSGCLGVLCVERPVEQTVTEAEVDRLQAFADHAAGQLRGVRVYEDLQQRVEELSVLCDISRELSSSLERDRLLSKIVDSSCTLLHCGMASLMLFDDDKQSLRILHAMGLPDEVVAGAKIVPGEGVAGWVAEHGEPLLIEDITQDSRFFRPQRAGEQSRKYSNRSLLSVPLLIGTEVVGVLNVNNKINHAIFTPRDRDNLALLASQAAVSIENARLYETLQRLAVTDPLTKLFRRNYFEEQVDAEISRCVRYKRPLSVMMIDIDHFKSINDTYGHQMGDQVLVGLAGLLRRYGRKDDVIARYGGEEFVALLVETDDEGAQMAGERIREATQAFAFDAGRAEPLRITVSVGHASYPDHTDTLDGLVGMADLALYAAKHGGRNQVRGYQPGLDMPAG